MAMQLNKLDPKLFRYLPLSEECTKIAAKNGASETQGVIAGFIGITTYVAAKSLGIDKQIAHRGALAAAESVPNAAAAAKISTDKIIHPHQKYYAKLDAAAAMVARAADEGLTGADPVDRRKVAAAVEAALINITTLLNKIDMKNSRKKNSTMSGGFGIGDVVDWVGKKAEDIGSYVGSFFHSPSNTTSSVTTPQQRDESVYDTVDFGQQDDAKTTTTTTTTDPPFTAKQLEEAVKEAQREKEGQEQVEKAVAKSKWKETLIGKLIDKVNVWIKKHQSRNAPALLPKEKRIQTWAICGGLLFSALFMIGGVATYFNPPETGQTAKTTVDDLVAQFQEQQQDDPNGLWVTRNYTSQDIQRFEDYNSSC